MTIKQLEKTLAQALDSDADAAQEIAEAVRDVSTFSEAGVLTSNAGLVIRMRDGREFQLTIVQSR